MINKIHFFLFIIFFYYLFYNTGLHGDDYIAIYNAKNKSFIDFVNLNPNSNGIAIFYPVNYLLFWWLYFFANSNYLFIFDTFKFLINLLSLFFIYKFLSQYISFTRAIVLAFLIITFPLHESTMYWYMASPYVFTAGMIMISHYLINKQYYKTGFILLIIGTFTSYASPPYVFGLSIIFLFEKRFIRFLLFNLSGIAYIVFYLYISYKFPNIQLRIEENNNFFLIINNLLIQFLSSIDVFIGPSFWLKIFVSISSNSIFSILICSLFIFFIYISKINISSKTENENYLLFSFCGIFIFSILMFSLTGKYPQIAFNLGNRVTIFGSFLLAYLIILIPKKYFNIFLVFFLLAVTGISNHWKEWNQKQLKIINNINNNYQIKELKKDDILFIKDNQYSNLKIYSNIEFFVLPWIIKPIFSNHNIEKIVSINSNIKITENFIFDKKNGGRMNLLNNINKKYNIFLYDTETNKVSKESIEKIKKIKLSTPKPLRHWLQLINLKIISKYINKLNPRYINYFYEK